MGVDEIMMLETIQIDIRDLKEDISFLRKYIDIIETKLDDFLQMEIKYRKTYKV